MRRINSTYAVLRKAIRIMVERQVIGEWTFEMSFDFLGAYMSRVGAFVGAFMGAWLYTE